MNGHGFVDLRLNHQRDQTAESFWPSFTDVMTVIVMIFLLAMLILLARNMDLVAELRATMAAQREAAELARARDRQRAELSDRLQTAEAQIARMADAMADLNSIRLDLDRRLEEERARANGLVEELVAEQARLSAREQRIVQLEAERNDLVARSERLDQAFRSQVEALERLRSEHAIQAEEMDQLTADRTELQRQMTDYRQELEALGAERERQREEIARIREQNRAKGEDLEQLRAAYRERAEELAAVLDRLETVNQRTTELQQDYDTLAQRYAKLVRPARSPRGRHLVEIRYAKVGGQADIRVREPGEEDFRSVSRSDLETRLTKLTQSHPEGLYIKVIFPENSGLSYDEAWRFTNSLHAKYDYYYQEP